MGWPTDDRHQPHREGGYGAQGGGAWSPPPHSSTPPPIPAYQPPQPGQWGQFEDRTGLPPRQPRPRYADFGERVAAALVDGGILIGAILVISTLTDWSEPLSSLGGLVWLGLAGYIAWLNGSKGQSPGKALMGLKLIRDADGTTLGGPVGLVRALALGLMGIFTGGLLFVLSGLWPLWDTKRQALHDKIVSATVIAGGPKAKFGKAIFLP